MPTIRVKENEPFETALRRFKRTIEKSGLLTELRAREFYEKPTAERKRKKAAAIKRQFSDRIQLTIRQTPGSSGLELCALSQNHACKALTEERGCTRFFFQRKRNDD